MRLSDREKRRIRAVVLGAFATTSAVGAGWLLLYKCWPWAWLFSAVCVGIAAWLFYEPADWRRKR